MHSIGAFLIYSGFGLLQGTTVLPEVQKGNISACLDLYRLSLSPCDVYPKDMNDPNAGLSLCSVSEVAWPELRQLMSEIHDMEPSSQEIDLACSVIEPLAVIGNNAFEHGWDTDGVQRSTEAIRSARWRLMSMHKLLYFNF